MLRRFPRLLAVSLAALVVGSLAPGAARADEPTGGRISGLIEDEHNAVLADATVRLANGATGLVTTAVSDNQGRYSASPPAGRYDLTVTAAANGAPLEARVRDVEVGTATKLNLVLAGHPVEPVTLTGRLRDGAGAPIPFARIWAGGETVTAPDGRFVLEVSPGHYPLGVGLPPAPGRTVEASVLDFDLSRNRHVELTLPFTTVEVAVRNGAGAPVPGARVHLSAYESCSSCFGAFDLYDGAPARRDWAASERTDADGRVRLVALASSALRVDVDPDEYTSPYTRVIRTGEQVGPPNLLEVVLPVKPSTVDPSGPQMTFTGTVLDSVGLFDEETEVSLSTDNFMVDGYTGTGAYGGFELTAPAGSYPQGGSRRAGRLVL